MDPLGFGLENFDAIGGWRTHDGEQPIDPSGKLPGGRAFQGPAELRAALLARRDAFARCLAEKMLTYALGRGLDRADRRAVDQIVARLARRRITGSRPWCSPIVESDPFRNRDSHGGRAMSRRRRISRRTVLRGLGASVALPWLEAMRPGSLSRRIGRSRTAARCAWRSSTSPTASTCPTGRRGRPAPDFELPAILEPLRAVKDDLLVLSGLTLNPARALGDGGGDHARAMASFLTGRHPRKTDGADLRAGDLGRSVGRPGDRPVDPLPLAGDRLRGGQERRQLRPRL